MPSNIFQQQEPKLYNELWGEIHTSSSLPQYTGKVDWFIDGIIPKGQLTLLCGHPGSEKSMLVGALAISATNRKPWFLNDNSLETFKPVFVHSNNILWIDLDNGRKRLDDRFIKLKKGYNVKDTSIYTVSMPLENFDASSQKHLSALTQAITDLKIDTVIIDTLLTAAGVANENSSEMGRVVNGLYRVKEETGTNMIALHHLRKNSSDDGYEGNKIRGHSSIAGKVDYTLHVNSNPKTEELTVTVGKVRDRVLSKGFVVKLISNRNDVNDYKRLCKELGFDIDPEQELLHYRFIKPITHNDSQFISYAIALPRFIENNGGQVSPKSYFINSVAERFSIKKAVATKAIEYAVANNIISLDTMGSSQTHVYRSK